MTIDEFLLRTTIRIETITNQGNCSGTGFFFGFCNNKETNQFIPTIVTNKHVIKGAKTGKLRFSIKDADGNPIKGKYYDLKVDYFEERWIMHPDTNIDLCILPIASIHQEIQKSGYDLHYTCLTNNDILSEQEIQEQLSLVEDITVVGYPDGIWDSYNNMPIVRRGITATPIQYDFENETKFLIDAAIYGGSSGSPVFLFNQGVFSVKGGAMAGSRIKLIGIVYAVAQHSVTGQIKIVDVPVAQTPLSVTNIPNNLGVVIKVSKLLEFEGILLELDK